MDKSLLTDAFMFLIFDEESEYLAVIDAITEHLGAFPENWRAWNNRGVANWELGRGDDARTDFEQAVERSSFDVIPLANRARLRMDAGDLEGAVSDYSAALEQAPSDIGLLTRRGDAYKRMGNPGAASIDHVRASALRTINDLQER